MFSAGRLLDFLFTTFTASSLLPPITVNCLKVTSLICSNSMAFARLHSFSLNRRALAALLRAPSTSLSCSISSCKSVNSQRSARRQRRRRYWLTVYLVVAPHCENVSFMKNVLRAKCFSKWSSIVDVFVSSSGVRLSCLSTCLHSVPITAIRVATCIASLFFVSSVAVA